VELAWRRQKSAAFDLAANSTARSCRTLDLWGTRRRIYTNANLSIYSAQSCNARCAFCVEELRPASRGGDLARQKSVERDDARYFARLEETLDALAPLDPSVSITGGEASKDPRLPRLLALLARRGARKRTLTTNGSGLFDVHDGRTVLESIAAAGLEHVNVSIAHPDLERNAALMRFRAGLPREALRRACARLADAGVRVRLSCVLVEDGVRDLDGVRAYLDFARDLGVDNVIFRQLMRTDPATHAPNEVVRWSDAQRVRLEPLLDRLAAADDFAFQRQIVGYYYYASRCGARTGSTWCSRKPTSRSSSA
jgi:cyclic pyranopterin phosphate synthase